MNSKSILLIFLCLFALGASVIVWRIQSVSFRPDQVPILLKPTGNILLFEPSDGGNGFTRRQFGPLSVESIEIVNWNEHQTGWGVDRSTPDPSHGTAISADVYSINIGRDKILLHFAKSRSDDDDHLVTISRSLSADESRFLNSIVARIKIRNPTFDSVAIPGGGMPVKR